jgi:hypothetical protein
LIQHKVLVLKIFSLHLTGTFLNLLLLISPSFVYSLQHPLHIKEEIIEISSTTPMVSSLPSIIIPDSPPDNRRASTRQQKRRTFRDSKDSSTSTKKKTRLDSDINSNLNVDNITNSDHIPIPIEQQSAESMANFDARIFDLTFLYFK